MRADRAAIALMAFGMLLFALNDAMGKWLVATYGVGQVLLIRSAAALLILAPFVWRAGLWRLLRPEQPRVQLLRVAFSSAEVFCFYWAVQFMTLADTMTVWLAAPILVAALSPVLLGERVVWQGWVAILVGFVGVVLALDPSQALFAPANLVALAGMACFAGMMITGRSLRGTPDTGLVLWQLLGALVAGALTAPFGWAAPQGIDLGLLALLGLVAMTAHVCVNRALKWTEAAVVAPVQYLLLVFAVVFGWLFFRDIPRIETIAGAAIVMASGLFLFWRPGGAPVRQADRPA